VWTEHDPVSAEAEMADLLYAFVRMLKPKIVVETGTYRAFTSKRLGEAVRDNGLGHVYTCDIQMGAGHLLRIEGLPVTFRQCEAFDLPELKEADFVFCDSGTHDIRKKEYEYLKSGAVYVVHDTTQTFDPYHLGEWVIEQGGIRFNAGRGFGVIIHP